MSKVQTLKEKVEEALPRMREGKYDRVSGLRLLARLENESRDELPEVEYYLPLKIKGNDKRTILSYAAELGYKEAVRIMIRGHKLDVDIQDFNGRTPLSYVGGAQDFEVVKIHNNYKANISIPRHDGSILFPYTQGIKDRVEIAKLLISVGGNSDVPDKDGRTPLFHAIEKNKVDVGELLLQMGANQHVQDKDGRTPLSYAAEKSNKYMVVILLLKDASPHVQDKHGRTALSYAAERGSAYGDNIIRGFIEMKVDIDIPDKHGRAPLSYAVVAGNEDTARLLISAGAKITDEAIQGLKKEVIINGIKEYAKSYRDKTQEIQKIDNKIGEIAETAEKSNNSSIGASVQEICMELKTHNNSLTRSLNTKATQTEAKLIGKALTETEHTAQPSEKAPSSSKLKRFKNAVGRFF